MESEEAADLSIDVPPLPASPEPQEMHAATPTSNRAARGLGGQRRLLWSGPFATLTAGSAAWGSSSDDGDVTMATASPGRDTPAARASSAEKEKAESGRITNAPTLPAAPRYAGSTMKDRRSFMRAYETYYHALSAFDTGFARPFIMPVSGCIEERTCQMICMYEFQKNPNEVSEGEWISYFLQAREPELEDYTAVDLAMKQLKMKTTFPDAASRMGQLRADMHHILDEHTVEQVMLEREQKKVVKYFVAALEPAEFREAIQKRLQYAQHKALKTDIVKCYAWVLEQLKAYLVWQPAQVKPQARPQSKFGQQPRRPQQEDNHSHGAKPGPSSGNSSRGRAGPTEGKPPPKPRSGNPPRRTCLKCGSQTHLVRQCPDVTPDEVDKLLAARNPSTNSATSTHFKRVQVVNEDSAETGCAQATTSNHPLRHSIGLRDDDGTAQTTIDGFTLQTSLLDSGADDSVVSGGIVRALESAGVPILTFSANTALEPVGGHLIPVARKVRFGEVEFATSAGPLLLRNLDCLVHEEDRSLALTVGRPVMNRLGYSTDGLLAAARTRQPEYCLTEPAEEDSDKNNSPLVRVQAMRTRLLDELDVDGDDLDELVASPRLVAETTRAVQEALELKIQEARANGLTSKEGDDLQELLFRHIDVFRLSFGDDPPVRVPPLRVHLKEGARPVKAKARRYPPDHKRYLEEHIEELVRHGLVKKNHRSRWASAPRIVAKRKPGEYRMTVDTRAVNALTEPMPWPMPDIEADLAQVEDSEAYFTIDWWRGYWQLPLDEDSQELYTIMTHRGMFTPTRVLMGSTDAVAYCQGVVEEIFGPLRGGQILAWLDDILGYARSPSALLVVLKNVLELCADTRCSSLPISD
ncbi:Retrovirus-related Pol polyprotein from transposon 297 [Phytophthora ramorum]|uniref:Retrovirus-related Pol polyprotein from transposon 297 n=1 Tax=Phytophthora ramorum TaxID=164328 RepID=UPI0030A1E175|nr:Retrovirus-related Pol polyprotein from transposon 297 [Phytophthora ramorum]